MSDYRPHRIGAYVPPQSVLAYRERQARRAAAAEAFMREASRLLLALATVGAVAMCAVLALSLFH